MVTSSALDTGVVVVVGTGVAGSGAGTDTGIRAYLWAPSG